MRITRNNFFDVDVVAAINKTSIDGTDFTSKQLVLAHAQQAGLSLFVQGGNAGCSKDVIFVFVAWDSKRGKWDTVPFLTVNVTATGITAVQKTVLINGGVELMKILSVQNQETVAGYTATVNVSVFTQEW